MFTESENTKALQLSSSFLHIEQLITQSSLHYSTNSNIDSQYELFNEISLFFPAILIKEKDHSGRNLHYQ